ncbi:TlpA family protein disulfide reductase [Campylobacter sp. MIT 97-5078]|uniref:TlpA family protein disulfide reductase n=1 Tax=Campylobacter sp. MIT 97-5078 TaxID=1548153 RepID=UPI000513E408|nr:TlpA disulfide reductase family protein [Campylobacter sp. MIT 97-5078]KGI56115.1 hypothetical protein LR59_08905 [Campylobacter sp. MIT 97-5078]KGI57103.1 hypothetical protein LR59_04560 [Campylobacter sp. MIT 97-5078]TQR25476.1 TlpA family protein disulfide reductase [Campylobacter sp. MIT 97-5078]
MRTFKFIFSLILSLVFLACEGEKRAELGKEAPPILAKNLQGEAVKLSDFDQRLKIIVFFENGCAACIKELPLLDEFVENNQDKIVVLAINSVDEKEVINSIKERFKLEHIMLLKDDLDISWQRYAVFALPTTFIIKDGIVQEKIIGDKPWQSLQEKLLSLL